MTEQPYQTPAADLAQQPTSSVTKRTAPTVWGIIYLILAVLGFLLAGFGMVVVIQTDLAGASGMDTHLLVIDSLSSMTTKVLLFLFGLALLNRYSWVLKVCVIGLVINVIDSVIKLLFVVPHQAEQAGAISEAAAFGSWVGFGFMFVIGIALYLPFVFYLRSAASKQEFGIR